MFLADAELQCKNWGFGFDSNHQKAQAAAALQGNTSQI
jgi:hypothetical protein